jgi:outer membrane receptor protein involved in Fe transport
MTTGSHADGRSFSGDAVEKSSPIVRARGAEVGVRTVAIRNLQSTASLWYLSFDSELFYVGDSGSTEIGPPSRRVGVELTNYYRVHPWVTLDLDISFSRARFRQVPPGEDRVPGALNRVMTFGSAVEPPEGGKGPVGSIRLRHFGPRPLIEDASIQSSSTSIVNGEIGYKFSDRFRLVLEGFNLFDAKVSDIEYYYASRLPGEPEEGIEDIHLHPALPRSARISLRVSF